MFLIRSTLAGNSCNKNRDEKAVQDICRALVLKTVYSGIRAHWGEEEKERGRLFCRIENQIINPVGMRP